MEKERRRHLLSVIECELMTAVQAASQASILAKEFSNASFSQSGEREIYGLAAEVANEAVQKLLALREETLSASTERVMIVGPVCFVELDYGDGENEECYLVNNAAKLPGIVLITTKSAVGNAIAGRKQGETVSYSIARGYREVAVSCKIITVE